MHILRHFHLIREIITVREVVMDRVLLTNYIAAILKKPLAHVVFECHFTSMRLMHKGDWL